MDRREGRTKGRRKRGSEGKRGKFGGGIAPWLLGDRRRCMQGVNPIDFLGKYSPTTVAAPGS